MCTPRPEGALFNLPRVFSSLSLGVSLPALGAQPCFAGSVSRSPSTAVSPELKRPLCTDGALLPWCRTRSPAPPSSHSPESVLWFSGQLLSVISQYHHTQIVFLSLTTHFLVPCAFTFAILVPYLSNSVLRIGLSLLSCRAPLSLVAAPRQFPSRGFVDDTSTLVSPVL